MFYSTRQREPHAVSEHWDVRKPFRQRQRQGFVKIKGKTRAAYELTVDGKNVQMSPDNFLFSCVQSLKFFKQRQKRKWSYSKLQINKSTEVSDNNQPNFKSVSPAKFAPPSPPTQPRTPPPTTASSMFMFGRPAFASSHKHIMQHFRHFGDSVFISCRVWEPFWKAKRPQELPTDLGLSSRLRLLRVQLIAKRSGTAGNLSRASQIWKRLEAVCHNPPRQHPQQRTGSVTLHHMDSHQAIHRSEKSDTSCWNAPGNLLQNIQLCVRLSLWCKVIVNNSLVCYYVRIHTSICVFILKDQRLRTGNFKVYIMVERVWEIQNMQPNG